MKIRRSAIEAYELSPPILTGEGEIDTSGFQAVRTLSHRLNAARDTVAHPESLVRAGELYGLALIDRIYRGILLDCRRNGAELDPGVLLGAERGKELQALVRREFSAPEKLDLIDLMLIRIANANPASRPVRELIDEAPLTASPLFGQLMSRAAAQFDPPAEANSSETAIEMLTRPFRLHPDSVYDQLDYIRREWSDLAGPAEPILLALDLIREETRPFFGGGPGEQRPLVYAGGDEEGFSTDTAWMPLTVMIAKNTLVWLDQLGRSYGRAITRLDEIPGAELDRLARQGFNALWLIGIWTRSPASRRIKHLVGNSEAEASAYSLTDYTVSPELGGDEALESLRIEAAKRGIRLASDMVPNHTGIDADWIYDHPEYYIQTPLPPYPSYSFSGENLARREGYGTFLEDHYLDRSDAAVVFKHIDYTTNRVRYIYHGNDGTSMPWNDTAQLNYLNPDLREAVIGAIIGVARQFPIIRFDAAMTLAREHIRRLWYPQPGQGGTIPSRSEYAMSEERFELELPREFWREVVDRVAAEAPDTLLLAEAFWMMEGYFVRTLGMHRVYNSAFMNMLKNEENEKYRQTLKNTLEFDREILKRFVNFMNNPDEDTAVAQFGRDDKYFGVCTMLVTMPGLPMFGHGQVEGFTEKYGMEYRRASRDERPDEELLKRHEREIFPLLKRRGQFAEAEEFTLFDFIGPSGVNQNVFAYTNRDGEAAALVLYNNSSADAAGTVRMSVPFRDRTRENQLRRRSLGEALDIPDNPRHWLIMRQHATGLEFIRNCREIARHGLHAVLPPYGCQVYLDFRIQPDDRDGSYRQLAESLKGSGCDGIDREMRRLFMQPLHRSLAQLLRSEVIDLFRKAMHSRSTPPADFLSRWEKEYQSFLSSAALEYTRTASERRGADAMLTTARGVLHLALHDLPAEEERGLAGFYGYLQRGFEMRPEAPAVFAAWCITDRLGEAFEESSAGYSRSLIDEWHLSLPLSDIFRDSGLGAPRAEYAVSLVKLLTNFRDWHDGVGQGDEERVLAGLLHQEEIQRFLLVNRWDDVLWFNKDRFEDLCWWFFCIAAVSLVETGETGRLEELFPVIQRWLELEEASEYRIVRLMEMLESD